MRIYKNNESSDKDWIDFDKTEMLRDHLEQDLVINTLQVFPNGNFAGEQAYMTTVSGTIIRTSSAVVIKQMKEQEKLGLPVKVRFVEIESMTSDYSYFSLAEPETG